MDTLAEIGRIESIFRYPVKSMRGERLESARLGWHGLFGDRRLALRRIEDRNISGFPWLTAGKLPELLLFTPERNHGEPDADIPPYIRTPEGQQLPIFSEELAVEVQRRHGSAVQMMYLKHGIFDDAPVSVIATDTIDEIARLAGNAPDARRFRPNIVVRLVHPRPFGEADWMGGTLSFGEGTNQAAVTVTKRDVRCSMVNFDPDVGRAAPEVLKSVVAANANVAGIYGGVARIGELAVGQTVFLNSAG